MLFRSHIVIGRDGVEIQQRPVEIGDGVTRGAVEDMVLSDLAPKDAEVKRYEDNNTTISAYLSGQVQYMATGNVVVAAIARQNPEKALNFLTPHQKWGIHSTYSDNLLMLTLGRGGPVVWLSEADAKELGIADNDWIEVFNSNGHMMTGWIQLDGKYYYLNPANEGKMIAGTTATINGVQYNFDGSGVCQNANGVSAQTPGTVNNNSGSSGGSGGPGVSGSSGSGISSGTPGGSGNSSNGPTSGNSNNSPSGSSTALEPGRTDGPG